MRKEDIIARFEKDFERDQAQCTSLHETYREDKKFFLMDEQWTDQERTARNVPGQPPRPMLTVNRMRQFLMQVINDHKQARMGIRVTPAGGEEDVKLAQVRQGIIRAIERNNGGPGAYNQAKEDQVGAGFGAWRLYADYIGHDSHEQEPKYLPIYDCTKLFWPVLDCMEPDYSDMDNAIIQEHWSKERFKQKTKLDPEQFLATDSNRLGAWGRGQSPCISEYYFREELDDILVKDLEGKSHFLSVLEKKVKDSGQDINLDDFLAVDEDGKRIERDTIRCKVWWAKLAGKTVLGKPIELPGQYIPVFIANGRKVYLDGKLQLWSLGRPAKDTQKSHNYACSAELERLALSPKVPFMVAEESIPKGEEAKWATINTGNHPYVKFKAFTQKGDAIPPPIRTASVQSDPGFINLKMSTVDEMKAVLGMYDPSLGKQGSAVSGVAINAQRDQGSNATYDFADNMAIAIRHCGRVLNEWIPTYIDTPRQVRMIGDDDAEKVITVNKEAQDEKGSTYNYVMTEGKFDIAVDSGPSASTKREQTTQDMKEFYQAFPAAAGVTGHLFAKEQDWRFKDEFSTIMKRLANLQFPGVVEDENAKAQDPQQMQAAMQQMQQQMQQMGQQLQQAQQAVTENQQLKIKIAEAQADKSIEKERVQIEWFKAKTEAGAKGADAQVKQGGLALKADELQHDKQMDRAGLQMDAQAMQHGQAKDGAEFGLKARGQQHQQSKDQAAFQQSGEKMRLDYEAKKSQQGKPTGGKPGNRPSGKA
jgi:hypothetical protein